MRASLTVVLIVASVVNLCVHSRAFGEGAVDLEKVGRLEYQWSNLAGLRYSIVEDITFDEVGSGKIQRITETDYFVDSVSKTGGLWRMSVRSRGKQIAKLESGAAIEVKYESGFFVDVDRYGKVSNCVDTVLTTNNSASSGEVQIAKENFLTSIIVQLPQIGCGRWWVNRSENSPDIADDVRLGTLWCVENSSGEACEIVARGRVVWDASSVDPDAKVDDGGTQRRAYPVWWECRYTFDRKSGLVRSGVESYDRYGTDVSRDRTSVRITLSGGSSK